MRWLFEALREPEPHFSEPKVDCQSCQLKGGLKRPEIYSPVTKCCQFSPFWSAFGVGAWLEEGHSLKELQSPTELIFTPLGILHSLPHRLNKKALCTHFSSPEKGCQVWTQRPPICISFFCASQYPEGLRTYGELEKWLLKVEAEALKVWFDQLQLSIELWELWGEYMEPRPKVSELPSEMILTDIAHAEALYKKAYESLKNPVFEKFLSHNRRGWQSGLARRDILC